MAVETNDGYGNGEIIEHAKPERPNLCPKCKLTDMKPNFMGEGSDCNYVGLYVYSLESFTKDNPFKWHTEVTRECIVWQCPECKYRIAKPIE